MDVPVPFALQFLLFVSLSIVVTIRQFRRSVVAVLRAVA
jgi:hypothetical protein